MSTTLTQDDVRKIAKLARIAVSEEETSIFTKELSKILALAEALSSVPTDHVPAMTTILGTPLPTRADNVTDGAIQDQVLANAPMTEYGYFIVPKVVE